MTLILKHAPLLFVLFAASSADSAESQRIPVRFKAVDQCDFFFEERLDPARSLKAAQCYADYLRTAEGNSETRRRAYMQAFASWAWVTEKSASSLSRRESSLEGERYAKLATEEMPAHGLGYYWKAYFQLKTCELSETAVAVALCLGSSKQTLRDTLEKAVQVEASVEGSGPFRLGGKILRASSPIAARDLPMSEKLLQDAYDHSPSDSRNHIEYARTLIALGENSLARAVLKPFTQLDCMTMNPIRHVECQDDQTIARALLQSGI